MSYIDTSTMTRGRHRKTDGADSIDQASSKLGMDRRLLEAAKAAGCAAFMKSGRIDLTIAKEFIETHIVELQKIVDSTRELSDAKKAAEILKIMIPLGQKMGWLIEKAKVASAISVCAARIDSLLAQRLENEYPMLVVGQDIPGARIKGKHLRDQIMKDLNALAEQWPE